MLNQRDLDELVQSGCATPGCDHQNHDKPFFLHQTCHPGRGLEASYAYRSGVLSLACARCKKVVAEIAVESGRIVPLPKLPHLKHEDLLPLL